MDIFSKEAFIRLANIEHTPCVSIYIPTHRGGHEVNQGQDRIAIKNALNEVEKKLEERDLKPREITDLLAQARSLYDDQGFWRHQSDMLAVFIAPDFHMHYSLPLHCEKTIIVSDSLYLAPLLPLMVDEQYYYILALAKGSVHLYEATPYTITNIQIEDLVPLNLEHALRFDDPEQSLQHHSGTAGGKAIYHGQGGAKDVETENLQRYLQMVDKGLQALLSQENAPLVLAGDKNVTGEFKKLSHHKLIMEQTIQGNTEHIPLAELHEMSRSIVQPHFSQVAQQARERFNNLSNSTLSSTDVKDIVMASFMQKIDTLFVREQASVWGKVDFDSQKIEINQEPTGTELLNQAAVLTIMHGGKVYMLDGEMPTKNPAAAIYRFGSE